MNQVVFQRRVLPAAVILAGLFAAALPAEAADSSLGISAKIGGNWSVINAPQDPAGEPTLLSGSAFDGMGFTFGGLGHYHVSEFKGATFELEAGLLYSFHQGEGFEGVPATGEKRTLTLSSHMLQIPILLYLKGSSAPDGFRLGVGITPLFGLQSGALVELENSSEAPEAVETSPAVHVGLSAALGYDILVNEQMSIPLELRVNWDPFVGKSTHDRYTDFESMEDPGAYQVAFNWQFFFMTGFRYQL